MIDALAPVAGYTADDVAKTPPDRIPVTFRADAAMRAELDARGTPRSAAAKLALQRYLDALRLTMRDPTVPLHCYALVREMGPFVVEGLTQRMSADGMSRALGRMLGLHVDPLLALALVDALERAHRLGGFADENLRAVGLLPEVR